MIPQRTTVFDFSIRMHEHRHRLMRLDFDDSRRRHHFPKRSERFRKQIQRFPRFSNNYLRYILRFKNSKTSLSTRVKERLQFPECDSVTRKIKRLSFLSSTISFKYSIVLFHGNFLYYHQVFCQVTGVSLCRICRRDRCNLIHFSINLIIQFFTLIF